MSNKRLLMTLIDHAIEVAGDGALLDWNTQLAKLDDKIQLIEEQIKDRLDAPPDTPRETQPEAQPETQPEAQPETQFDTQDSTQYLLHSLEFEKMTLEGSLDSAAAALATTKAALDRETRRRVTLEGRLGELEDRLLETLGM
ncbi:MAG: hypothetical protein GY854_05960 [Deltaproteobacteria bacterium]|nr:hypothetical protein [Deltaproteobacteria bacterium]